MKQTLKRIGKKIPGALNARMFIYAYNAPIGVIADHYKKMETYKNCYCGKRCFVIGNGPSLTAEDLDKIKNEYSFAANEIFRIFDHTDWRPTFYCIQDYAVFERIPIEHLMNTARQTQTTFIRMSTRAIDRVKCESIPNLVYVPIWSKQDKKKYAAKFTKHADRFIYDGNTVTYMSMQLAAYMGFTEIYLLGVDHSFPFIVDRNEKVHEIDINMQPHFYENAESNRGEEGKKLHMTHYELITNSYRSAEEYSRKDGTFRIYNVTRGGKLEVFERVKLEDILKPT